MTELLERAIARLQTLPESEQDAIAAMILEEIEDDHGIMIMDKINNKEQEKIEQFVITVINYCELVEKHNQLDRQSFLVELNKILPLIYQQTVSLPSVDIEDIHEDEEEQIVRDKQSSQLFPSLQNQLKEWVYYFDVFDPNNLEEIEPVCSDLADDLTDIYLDLKSGLNYWLKLTVDNQIFAVWLWRFYFWSHTGQHITAAIRSIFWRLYNSDYY